MKPEPFVCSICFGIFVGWGNNAEPVNAGRCCDECNNTVVIPARKRRLQNRRDLAKDEQP